MSCSKVLVVDCFDFFNLLNPSVSLENSVKMLLSLVLKCALEERSTKVIFVFFRDTFIFQMEYLNGIGISSTNVNQYAEFSKFCSDGSVFLTNDKVFYQILSLSPKITILRYFSNHTIAEISLSDANMAKGRFGRKEWVFYCCSHYSKKDGFPGVMGASLPSARKFIQGRYQQTPSHRFWQRRAFRERLVNVEIGICQDMNHSLSLDVATIADICKNMYSNMIPLCRRVLSMCSKIEKGDEK